MLQSHGFEITPLDVKRNSAFNSVQPVIYDGEQLPFQDKSFDTVLLITVLHHLKVPEKLIRSAVRVGKQLLIMEDIYNNTFQKYLTFFADSLNNWEFIGHPHSNKTDDGWRRVFENQGVEVKKI